MNGPQDLGGRMGFGPVAPENNEPPFHAEWEKRALAVTLAAGACGKWNIDASRHMRESLDHGWYLTHSYYEIWAAALERLVVEAGMAKPDELFRGEASQSRIASPGLQAENVAAALARGTSCARESQTPQRFRPGEAVRTKVMHPATHTRLPGYASGKRGVIEASRGAFVFPDTNAHFHGEQPQWCYTVCFEARELWGEGAEPGHTISIDAFEPYLEPA